MWHVDKPCNVSTCRCHLVIPKTNVLASWPQPVDWIVPGKHRKKILVADWSRESSEEWRLDGVYRLSGEKRCCDMPLTSTTAILLFRTKLTATVNHVMILGRKGHAITLFRRKGATASACPWYLTPETRIGEDMMVVAVAASRWRKEPMRIDVPVA